MNEFVCLASERLPVARGTLKKPAIIVNYNKSAASVLCLAAVGEI